MYQAAVSFRPNKGSSLAVVFEDGEQGVLHMSPIYQITGIQDPVC